MSINFRGLNLSKPINRLAAGFCAVAVNARSYGQGFFGLRTLLTNPIITVSGIISALTRLNDTTPAGPVSGYTIISMAGTTLYNNSTPVATGFSGNPPSMIAFRPNTSVEPFLYIGDSAPQNSVVVAGAFPCTGMVKVRSDGLSRKMGVKEPQNAPLVSTASSTTSGTDILPATTIPWTNVAGANPSFNYGHSSGADGTSPVVISTPIIGSVVTLTVTGSATVNGATHAPGDVGPATATFPANFTGAGPTIVLGAFTNGAGVVVATGGPVNIGASATLTVPSGATQLQIGIDSSANTFNANSGSFSVAWIVAASAVATVVSTLGEVTAYVWGDSPQSGPVGSYIWKNPNDSGTGTARSSSTAPVTSTNNSWQFDSTGGVIVNPTTFVQWDTLNSVGSISGETNLFAPAFAQSAPHTTNFNACVVGTIFVPVGGTYSFRVVGKDEFLVGIGGGATVSGGFVVAPNYAQTETVVSGLPLVAVGGPLPDGDGDIHTVNFDMTFPASGSYQVEIDWDFWFHAGRTLVMTAAATPGASPTVIVPLPQGVRTGVSYRYVYRASETGATSNPSPASTPQVTPVLDNTVTPEFSPDPQVDKVDYYRQDEGLANFTYVATGPNTNPPTSIVDELTDLAAAGNQILQFDNFEPVPSIDLPRAGIVNVSGNVITWVSGDHFNIRWLAGTIILIGSPTQLAYSAVRRPSSTTSWDFSDSETSVPDGTNLVYNIAEPILAAQPLAYLFGPTDNINFAFGVGDPLRPGTLYWSKGSNLDAWPDTNQADVTDPSETLVNGAMTEGLASLFSIKRGWVVEPNFFNALATVTGTEGSTWTNQATAINRGLFIPRCLVVEGGSNVFVRVDDGIIVSPGGQGAKSVTDDTLYPLFAHEGSTPVSVVRNGITIVPPNDSLPQGQKFSQNNGYMVWDYIGIDANPHSLLFDIGNMAWCWDMYDVAVTARAANEGLSTQGFLVGCVDGTIRQLATTGSTETATATVAAAVMGGVGWMHTHLITIEYSSNATITLSFVCPDQTTNGSIAPASITLPSTAGTVTKWKTLPSFNKWKFLQPVFTFTDPTVQIYIDGTAFDVKAWGSNSSYEPINPFAEGSGGFGGQP